MITQARLYVPPSHDDHGVGPEDSSLVLLEYGDYECPFCAQALSIVDSLRDLLGQSFRYVFRNFPLSDVHPNAVLAARAAEAAALQGRFWEMHHLLFLNQPLLRPDSLLGYARSLRLDLDAFTHDMQSPAVQERIRRDLRGAMQAGVHGTPTFYINGRRYDGPVGERALLADLEVAREQAQHSA